MNMILGVSISPNSSGLPGIAELDTIVGALLTIGLIASLAGLVISAMDPQFGVAVQTWDTFVSGGLIALRDPAPGK